MVKGAKYMVTEGDSALGDQHTAQYTDNALKNHILETYIILLTNITPIHLIKF